MKKALFLFLIILAALPDATFAQLKADWTFYGSQFGYVDGKFTDNQFSVLEATDFKILKDGSFIFTSRKGPISVFKNGNMSVLEKIFDVTGSVKTGLKIEGARAVAVDKNGNLFLHLDNNRLFMIEAKYFNGGIFSPNNLDVVPAKQVLKDDGFIYKVVSGLANDSRGNIWVRGDISDIGKVLLKDNVDYKNGIAKFDGAKWETTDIYGTQSEPIAHIAFDGDDNAILQFPQGRGATMVYTFSSNIKPDEKPLSSRGVPLEIGGAVAMDFYNGTVYLATSSAVHGQKNGQWERLSILPLTNIVDMKVDKTGFIWIASNEGVTCIRPNGSQYQLNSENSILPTNFVQKIAVDSQNKKWFVSDAGLVGYKEPAEPKAGMSIYTKLNSNYLNGRMEGIENFDKTLLLLNSDYGLVSFDGTKFKQETPEDLGGLFFNDLAVGSDGKAYIGTYRYLHVYDGKSYTKVEWKDDIGKQVTAVVMDNKNTLWIGFDGISKLENGAWQNFNKKNAGLSSNTVYKLFKDSKGNLWGALSDGIVKYDGTTWTSFTKKTTDIGLRNMIGFAETNDGRVWFSNGAKLVESDGTTMKEVANFKSVGSIRNMISQDDGSLLIATEDKGIAKVKDGNVTFFNQSTGLPSNAISRIFKDKDNAIWATFGFPPPSNNLSSAFNQPPGGQAPPQPPPPTPKEIFNKKLEASEIRFGLVKLSSL